MSIAEVVSRRSTCLRRNVGAVIVSGKRILATGYNGAPSGLEHCDRQGCFRLEQNIPSGERHELCKGLHAEQNAIIQAALYGVSIRGGAIYCTHHPCVVCAKTVSYTHLDVYKRQALASCLQTPVLTAGRGELRVPLSPGMKYRHYAPRAELILFKGSPPKIGRKMADVCHRLADEGRSVGVLCTAENSGYFHRGQIRVLGRQADLQEVAASFYRALRDLDRSGVDVILGEGFREEEPLGLALMNRLQKAADQIIDVV